MRANPVVALLAADFIVVGAGTAGLVLAARLSETKGVKVFVLEAGSDYSLDPLLSAVVSIPGLDAQGAGADVTAAANILEIDWGFTTVPRESFGNRQIHYERGKTLGGSSTRNFMIYQRGTASTYDAWAALGNEGWDWKGLKPYFDKSVNYLAPDNALRRLAHPTPADHAFTGCSSSHEKRQIPVNPTSVITVPTLTATSPLPAGTVTSSGPPQPTSASTIYGSGPVSLSVSPYPQELGSYMIGSMKELGFPEATSFNNGVLRGVQFVTSTIQQSFQKVVRTTSRSSYLFQAEAAGREASSPDAGQLVVLTRALVKRIIFEKGTTRAIGVVFVTSEGATTSDATADAIAPGVETELYANEEVLISAGAFQSPQLLMVSGVGPRDVLKKVGIDVVVDLAGVGQGMEDHIMNGITYPVSVETINALASNVTFQNLQLSNWTLNGLGPFTSPISDVIGFERLSDSTLQIIGAQSLLDVVPNDWPHLEYMISPGFMGNFSNLMAADNAPLEPVGQQYGSILSALAAPQSRGTISLASSDMADHPIIDPGWLTSPIDQAVAIAGFRRLRQFFATSFMGQILEGGEVFPGHNVSTDSEILEFVRHNSMTVWHASCTCSMKPRAMGGVLDARLRVHGTTGLRVVDASSFPSLPPGHPQSTVYALAEKASDLIKEDTRCD